LGARLGARTRGKKAKKMQQKRKKFAPP